MDFGLYYKQRTEALLPAIPSGPNFTIRPNSSMAKLKNLFDRIGLSSSVGINHLLISTPTDEQRASMRAAGLDDTQAFFHCKPRRPH